LDEQYIERAENIARLLEVNLQFILDFQGTTTRTSRSTGVDPRQLRDNELFETHYESADTGP